MKKFYPYLLFVVFLIIFTFTWDKIKLPYNENNLIQGEYFFKKYNPFNEILRFCIFIFIPLTIFLISYLKFNENTFEINPNSNYFFLKKKFNLLKDHQDINNTTIILLTILILEFFILDFKKNLFLIDVFHDGTFLVPPINYSFKKSFWLSTIYDYGFIANNLGLFFSKLTNFYTIGSIRFSFLILTFLNKILLVLICRKLSLTLNFDKNIKNIFFLILSLMIVNFSNYNLMEVSIYPQRVFVFLIFFLLLIDFLTYKRNSILKPFVIGAFSLISILWWIDIGIYINGIIIVLLAYLITQKEYKKIYLVIFGIIAAWSFFVMFFSSYEVKEFFYQIKFIASVSDYLLGMEYPKPFSADSTRATRALLLIALTGIFLIIMTFNKKLNINFETKIIIIFLFISSIFFFKSGLMRSDTPHIKYSSGSYMFLFYFFILYFIFLKSQNLRFIIFLNNLFLKKKIILYFIIFIISFFSILKFDIKNISNILNVKTNIKALVYAKDDVFITEEYKKFTQYFSEISKDDACVQILTGDISLPYLLKKPSCTQFYIPGHILINWSEKKFINQIKKSSPDFILYSSPLTWITKKENMPNVELFIKKNYYLFNDFMGRTIYKKK